MFDELLCDGGCYGNFLLLGFCVVLGFYLECFQCGEVFGVSEVQIGNFWQEFGCGSFVFYLLGFWDIGEFKCCLLFKLVNVWIIVELFGLVMGGGLGCFIVGGVSFVMFKCLWYKFEVWVLINYLSWFDVQFEFYCLIGDLFVWCSVWVLLLVGVMLVEDCYVVVFYCQFQCVCVVFVVFEWECIEKEMQFVVMCVVYGVIDFDIIVCELDVCVDGIFEKCCWMLDRVRL